MIRRAAAVAFACAAAGSSLAAQTPDTAERERPAYRSNVLRLLVTRAAARAAIPANFSGWFEQEAANVRTVDEGGVFVQTLQQTRGPVELDEGVFTQGVTEYRGEAYELDTSLEQGLRPGWLIPLATGDRFRLRQPVAETPNVLDRLLRRTLGILSRQPDTLLVVHPLAADREKSYRFGGGDTVALTLESGEGLTAVRIEVTPRQRPPRRVNVFTGDVYLDVRTLQLRRMIGRVDGVVSGVATDVARARRVLSGNTLPIAYLDLQTAIVDGGVVPALVRIEQTTAAVAQDAYASMHVVGRTLPAYARQYRSAAGGASPPPPTYRVRDAGAARGPGWTTPFGETTRALLVAPSPFTPWWPERMRERGPAIGRFEVARITDLYRFNRVEGWFTGAGVSVRFRDRMPGAIARVTAGWAWHERTVRGRAEFSRRARDVTMSVVASRELDVTNDFRSPLDVGSTWLPALLSVDAYDYVDRRTALVRGEGQIGTSDLHARVDVGIVSDQPAMRSVTRGLIGEPFLPNRGVDAGRYGRLLARLDWDRHADFDPRGQRVGGALIAELAAGDLTYQRLSGRLVVRQRWWREGTFAAVLNAGALFGDVPPQQLFELGEQQHLPGYAYKEFAGDRAASLDLIGTIPMGILREPIGEVAGFVIPAIVPAVQLGATAGWTELSSAAARASAARLGALYDPLGHSVLRDAAGNTRTPGATGTVRATVSVGLQLFGGATYVGAGRAVDGVSAAPQPWRAVLAFGRQF
ncbi:MAG: hypothetical protein SFW08_10150 [Gemmatimonadaceae bacterium]|nr:hypothetical protein [Gemmatimonadaceae bacterium]